jgi:hypothetical protein
MPEALSFAESRRQKDRCQAFRGQLDAVLGLLDADCQQLENLSVKLDQII